MEITVDVYSNLEYNKHVWERGDDMAKKPVNEKWNEHGEKRSGWYGCLYSVAIGRMDIKELEDLGIDEGDLRYIEQTKEFAAQCKKNGIVMQFSHPFD